MTMAKYLSIFFEKYEDEAIFAASKCGLPVSTLTKPESVANMVDYSNIILTSLRIIFNYIRDAFGKHAILPEESVHNLGTGYLEVGCGTYEYEREKGMEKKHIKFWYIQADFLNFEIYRIMCEEANKN